MGVAVLTAEIAPPLPFKVIGAFPVDKLPEAVIAVLATEKGSTNAAFIVVAARAGIFPPELAIVQVPAPIPELSRVMVHPAVSTVILLIVSDAAG